MERLPLTCVGLPHVSRHMSPKVSQAPRHSSSFVTPTSLYSLHRSGILLIIEDSKQNSPEKNHVASMLAFKHKGTFLAKKQHLELHPASFQVSNNIRVKLSPCPEGEHNASWRRGSWGMGNGNQTGSCLSKEKSFYWCFSTSQDLSSYLSAKVLSPDAVTLPGLTQGTEGAQESCRNTPTPNRGVKDSP